jgi:hypothetical protein
MPSRSICIEAKFADGIDEINKNSWPLVTDGPGCFQLKLLLYVDILRE